MRTDSLIYRLAYRGGTPPWDTGQPHPELDAMIGERPPGRALDLGCGSGANAVELARRGWDVVGVDFVAAAIEAANRRARDAGVTTRFVNGDVSALRECGITGPFDLVIDVGCYHSIPVEIRDAYAREVAALTLPGADLRLAGIGHAPLIWRLMHADGVSAEELRRRFEPQFTLLDSHPTASLGRASGFVMYHLVREGDTPHATASPTQGRLVRDEVAGGAE